MNVRIFHLLAARHIGRSLKGLIHPQHLLPLRQGEEESIVTGSPQEEEPDRPHQTVVTLHRQPSCVVPPKELTFKVAQSFFFSWLKVIVVGDPGVGKTSFIHRFTSNVFCDDYRGTVGVDFSTALLDLPAGSPRVRLQLWDIAGQERFTWMTRVYYREVIHLISIFITMLSCN